MLKLILPVCVGAVLGATWVLVWLRRPPAPEVRERKRRLAVNSAARMVDGTILDVHGDELHYSYTVGGVEYTASQDVSTLRDRLPVDGVSLVGPATVKYSRVNPANSIVVCEDWSGVHASRPAPLARPDTERRVP